ncbi:hypothetical protein [Leucobacter sp. MMO-66]
MRGRCRGGCRGTDVAPVMEFSRPTREQAAGVIDTGGLFVCVDVR